MSVTTMKPSFFARVGNFLAEVTTASSRARQVTYLTELSDEELQTRGLKREDIVKHVYRDLYYI